MIRVVMGVVLRFVPCFSSLLVPAFPDPAPRSCAEGVRKGDRVHMGGKVESDAMHVRVGEVGKTTVARVSSGAEENQRYCGNFYKYCCK
jgi:hypothetical protein